MIMMFLWYASCLHNPMHLTQAQQEELCEFAPLATETFAQCRSRVATITPLALADELQKRVEHAREEGAMHCLMHSYKELMLQFWVDRHAYYELVRLGKACNSVDAWMACMYNITRREKRWEAHEHSKP